MVTESNRIRPLVDEIPPPSKAAVFELMVELVTERAIPVELFTDEMPPPSSLVFELMVELVTVRTVSYTHLRAHETVLAARSACVSTSPPLSSSDPSIKPG